jgi:predicted DNA-binding protein
MTYSQLAPDASFALRIPQDQLDELRAIAVRNDRTAAADVRRAIAAHLERQREAKPE